MLTYAFGDAGTPGRPPRHAWAPAPHQRQVKIVAQGCSVDLRSDSLDQPVPRQRRRLGFVHGRRHWIIATRVPE
jgi:hypothetical protein